MAMLPPDEVLRGTLARSNASKPERDETQKQVQNHVSPLRIDTPERAEKRLARLHVDSVGFERVLGADNFTQVSVLERSAKVARAVGRVRIRNAAQTVVGSGTGVMVSPRLLLTNNHVLRNSTEAAASQIEFNFQDGLDGRPLAPVVFGLDPDAFFLTYKDLDFTLVAVREEDGAREPLSSFGWCPLKAEEGKVLKGESLNIIQHPNGGPKVAALRENRLTALLDDFIHYETDTAPGSSGAPVFNDQWEVVALHHSGVPETDKDGNYLAIGGGVWTQDMGEHRLSWVANEGVRISRIVHRVLQESLAGDAERLRSELLSESTRDGAGGANSKGSSSIAGAPVRETIGVPQIREDGSATWTIPLSVSVHLGSGGRPQIGQPPAAPAVVMSRPAAKPVRGQALSTGLQGELDEALRALEESRARPYYDPEADETDRDAYYADIDDGIAPGALYTALSRLLTRTHKQKLTYKPARHVYPWVDLQPNMMLRSIYSALEFDPERVIREDLAIEAARLERLQEVLTAESTLGTDEALDLVEAQLPYNCEHVVPQSWFGKREPMRGDLHHLFACEWGCNSFRGNIPYWDFPDFEEVEREDCGKRVGMTKFEPGNGKGEAARAVLYFLLRYPGEIDDTEVEYERERIAILLGWHRDHAVTKHELHRNAAIFRSQGNRNPLIDFPDWAGDIGFLEGLG